MRSHQFSWLSLSMVIVLGCRPASPPSPAVDPSTVVESAIAAFGGRENIAKAYTGRLTMELDGQLQGGVRGKFRVVDWFQSPSQFKRVVEGTAEGEHLKMISIVNGNHCWNRMGDQPWRELPVTNPGAEHFPSSVFAPLLAITKQTVQITMLPDEALDQQMVFRIRAAVDGKPVSDLYFDRQTRLLVKVEKTLFDIATGRDRSVETFYSEFEMADGLAIPRLVRVVVDGSPWLTMKIREIEFSKAIDEEVFQDPTGRERQR